MNKDLDLLFIFIAFILASIAFTYLLKKKTSFETYYIITLIKSTKPIAIMRNLSKKSFFTEKLADFFVILGFGAAAVDFLYLREKVKGAKRFFLFLASALTLTLVFVALDYFALGRIFSMGPLSKDFFPFLAIAFGFSGFAGFTLASLAMQGYDIIIKTIAGGSACPGVAPLLPGIEIPNVPMVVPVHAWLSLFIILIIHEGMHGIMAVKNGFSLKSTGILLFGFLPIGAFVEPDEKELDGKEKEEPKKVLRFLAAGPGGNLLAMPVVMLLILVSSLIITPIFMPWQNQIKETHVENVYVLSVDKNTSFCGTTYKSPAYGILDENAIILAINGVKVKGTGDLQVELSKERFGEKTFTVKNPKGETKEVKLSPNELGTFGFTAASKINDYEGIPKEYLAVSEAIAFFFEFLSWLFMLSFLVAIANFLPIVPFDGGRMAKIILAPYLPVGADSGEKKRLVGKILFAIVLIIIAVNAIPLFR